MTSLPALLHQAIKNFYERFPALLWGIWIFSSFCLSLDFSFTSLVSVLIFSYILLWGGAEKKRKTILWLLIAFLLLYLYTDLRYQFPSRPALLKVEGVFQVEKVVSSKRKKNDYTYIGIFQSSSAKLRLPIRARFKNTSSLIPLAKYQVEGKISSQNKFRYSALFESATLKKRYPYLEKLYTTLTSLKSSLNAIIHYQVTDSVTADFLSAITLGINTNNKLKEHMMHKGLIHILAISGFHFSILSMCVIHFFRFFFSLRIASLISIFFLSFYFILIGPMPSVIRAWFCFCFWTISKLLIKPSIPINTLGLALIFVCFFDPLFVFHLGMQLSFAITAALLLFSSSLTHFFKKHLLFSYNAQFLYGKLSSRVMTQLAFFLGSSLSVHLVAIPLLLFYFHTFNFNGLIFNILLPFLMSICAIFTIIAILIYTLFPPLASHLFSLLQAYTQVIIRVCTQTGYRIDFPFYCNKINSPSVVFILLIILITGCYIYYLSKTSHPLFSKFL